MNYEEAVEYLYSQTPQFQQIGAAAYKPGLDTVRTLSRNFGNPYEAYPCIHVAGTNGKGSTAHSLAAILQSAGYRVGLFTSPHLVDFRERIRVNGRMISRREVVTFMEKYLGERPADLEPSFFELTTVLAFEWFKQMNVDVAVIEVGLGGRLDSTNIISPELSVITNISMDHTAQLGNTLAKIASEKAGIIKPRVPVVIGETLEETLPVFIQKAETEEAPMTIAPQEADFRADYDFELRGECQRRNLTTILTAVGELRKLGWKISEEALRLGLKNVCELTGLMGRWMTTSRNPLTICDTGHNVGGWEYLSQQLKSHRGPLWMVVGFVNDKDISHILPLMPNGDNVRYTFTRPSVPRGLDQHELSRQAGEFGLKGCENPSVSLAVEAAQREALESGSPMAMVFVGGSSYVVADYLTALQDK